MNFAIKYPRYHSCTIKKAEKKVGGMCLNGTDDVKQFIISNPWKQNWKFFQKICAILLVRCCFSLSVEKIVIL